ncbi:accessory factor UbiK family protein [Parvularcula sp. LCG005]|uniref:accessory factor UbiK family protein n=1 Tax=Parvularcula sp. LCG005 TaxID=3078805 RepID=UPI002941CD4A|nr:accessory factor UbiK family protein [Parvularcula sp. LCG005]WOI54634.1 accessory factor UbiK family protein [Parvularcula sp. LCG005]
MQSTNPLFDGIAKAMTEAAGMADGVRREAETVMHSQLQRFMADQDLVPREEFEAVRDMATKALAEIEALKAEIAALKGEGA